MTDAALVISYLHFECGVAMLSKEIKASTIWTIYTNACTYMCGIGHVNREPLQDTASSNMQKVTSGVFCAGSEFTGGGAPLSGADGRKPWAQPPPLLTRQCAKFSSSSLCLVSMTATAQRCLYMHAHIAGGGLCQLY